MRKKLGGVEISPTRLEKLSLIGIMIVGVQSVTNTIVLTMTKKQANSFVPNAITEVRKEIVWQLT
jgi:hypothetical protein